MTARHAWGEPTRFPLKTERECLNGCGIVKVTRHEGGRHWQEFWRVPRCRAEQGASAATGSPERIDTARTPVCERVMADT